MDNYYALMRTHYNPGKMKEAMVEDIHHTMCEELQTILTEYEVKMGNPYFTRTALVNPTLKDERKLELVCTFQKNKDALLESQTRRILTQIGEVEQGDYLYLPNNWESHLDENVPMVKYLVYSIPKTDHSFDEAIVMECQKNIKLVDEQGDIREFGLFAWDNKTRMRINSNDTSASSNSNFECFVKKTPLTAKLGYEITRLMMWDKLLGRYIYREVVASNPLDNKGLITLLLKESSYDPSEDNLELGIAEYNKQTRKNKAVLDPRAYKGIYGEGELTESMTGAYRLMDGNVAGVTWHIIGNGAKIVEVQEGKCIVMGTKGFQTVRLTATMGEVVYEKRIKVKGW